MTNASTRWIGIPTGRAMPAAPQTKSFVDHPVGAQDRRFGRVADEVLFRSCLRPYNVRTVCLIQPSIVQQTKELEFC